ncbi:MAG: tetratricopeptide repeat protein [Leptolyngbya sp.]|nr:tetratricopeptide repeat protein [Candidatus Melainabacteria bacterium]
MAEESSVAVNFDKDLADWLALSEQAHDAYGRRKLVPAEIKFKEAIQILERVCADELHKDDAELKAKLAKSHNNLGAIYHAQGKFGLAEESYAQAMKLKVELFGEDHFEIAPCYQNLAAVHSARVQYDKAEPLYRRAIAIKEKEYGNDSPELLTPLKNLLMLCKKQERIAEIALLEKRIKSIEPPEVNPGDLWQSIALKSKDKQ